MKIFNLTFLVFIAVFALQNANAGDTIYYTNQLRDSYVLWRVQFQPKGPKWPSYLNIKIDSVLQGSFFIDEKWETSTIGEKFPGEFNIKMDTSYLILAKAVRFKYANILNIMKENIFSDTPENRKNLSKKWNETTIIYEYPPRDPKRMNPKDIHGEYPEDMIIRKYDPFEEIEKRKRNSK